MFEIGIQVIGLVFNKVKSKLPGATEDQIELRITVGMPLPFENPETQGPVIVPAGVVSFTLSEEEALNMAESLKNEVKPSDLSVVTDPKDVAAIMKGQRSDS